ncbi:hypothetical protein [Nonomuraea jiangxiensis]|nr:hypothetical protein [Nonomuraea jiangxiensis]
MLVISALVAVVALFGLLAVARNRRRAGGTGAAALAVPTPYPPAPHHAADEPDENSLWRHELLNAIDLASQPLDHTTAPDPGPSTGDLEETAAWSEPVEPIIPTGALAAIINSGRGRPSEDPDPDPDPEPQPQLGTGTGTGTESKGGRHRHPASDDDEATETLPPVTGDHPNE